MLFLLFLINSLLLALALINFTTIRRPSEFRDLDHSILLLLPVRNEESNIDRILSELEGQVGVKNLKIVVIDDNSEDATREKMERHLSTRISVVSAPHPNPGWIGKVSALQYGYSQSTGADFVISIDADVHFEPDAIARAISTLEMTHLDFISPYPRQIAHTLSEKLIQPLLQWSWMSTVFLRGAEKYPLESTVICNGQFLAMRGSALRAIDGFQSVSNKVLDDIELGRSFVRAGFRGAVIDGSSIASTRMYSSLSDIRAGYGKSLHKAFGSLLGSLVAAFFIFATGVLPFLFAISGNLLAIGALIAIIATRIVSAASSGGRMRDSFLHPLSSILFLYLLYFSWKNRRTIEWKGRTL